MYTENSSNGVCYLGLTTTLQGLVTKAVGSSRSAALGRCMPERCMTSGRAMLVPPPLVL